MKRALLIAGGTVGGLGAVLAITPPQLTSSELNIAGGAAIGSSTGTSTAANASSSTSNATAAAETAPAKATAKVTASAKATATTAAKSSTPNNSTATNSASSNTTTVETTATPATSAKATPAPTKSAATPVATKAAATTSSTKSINGTFTGPSVFVNYGNVQVKITVVNGKITDAVAVQAPSGRNDRWTNMAVPILKQQTLAAQSANIKGVSGASYTAYGWYKSLQGALAEAGL